MVTTQFSVFRTHTRGQVYTLEAIIAATLIITAIVFALQATAITPLTASTANERVEVQQQTTANDLLNTAAANDKLIPTIVHWDTADRTFLEATPNGYTTGGPPTEFGHLLNQTFQERNIAFNMHIQYQRSETDVTSETVVYQGEPSDNAVSASRAVVLYNDTELTDGSGRELKDVENRFYANDVYPNEPVYNVVRVKLVVWRM